MNPIEISANLFNLVSVFLANRNSVHTWWIGIIGTALFAVLFYEVNLYADVTLQIFFISTSFYGWWKWLNGGINHDELNIEKVARNSLLLYILIALLVLVSYGSLLYYLTDASYPYIDSVILVFSVLAQLLLMSRKLETWYFWIIVDLVAVPLFASKGLYLTSAIYFGFLINAFFGLKNWKRIYAQQTGEI